MPALTSLNPSIVYVLVLLWELGKDILEGVNKGEKKRKVKVSHLSSGNAPWIFTDSSQLGGHRQCSVTI